jgi:DNA binding domain, excisionase family
MYNMDELKKKKILSKDEAAFYIGICVKTLTALMKKDGFPVLRLGRRVFIHREKLDEWIDENTGK